MKRNKMLGKPHILSLFHNKFNKFNNTGTPMFIGHYHLAHSVVIGKQVHVPTSGWQKTVIYLYWTWKQHMFFYGIKATLFHKKLISRTGSHSLIIGLSNGVYLNIFHH